MFRAVAVIVCCAIIPFAATAQTEKQVPQDRAPADVQIYNLPGDDQPITNRREYRQGQEGDRNQEQQPPQNEPARQDRETNNFDQRDQQSARTRLLPPEPDIEFQEFVTGSLGYRLPIFGQNLFRNVPSTFAPVDHVPVTPDYLIGPGDELLVRAWPMIYYPLQTLVDAGITEIMIVTGGNHSGEFLRLLRNGKDFGLQSMNFAYQEGEGGIADALKLAEPFVKGEKVCVVLGDNIIENNVAAARQKFDRQESGAMIMLKEVPDPERFGVPVFEGERLVRIEEKPKQSKSPYAVIGIYFYDGTVFERAARLKPSARGELEITDVNNSYLQEGKLNYSMLEGWWTDAGTFESLFRASEMVREKAMASQSAPPSPVGATR